MESLLVSITAISLILTVAMGLALLKVLRDERQRADARVALLAAAAAESPVERWVADPSLSVPGPMPEASPTVRELFADRGTASPIGRRLAIAGALAFCLVLAGYALVDRGGTSSGAALAGAPPTLPLELLALHHVQDPEGLTISGVVRNARSGPVLSHVAATAAALGADGALLASGRGALDYAIIEPGGESPFVVRISVTGSVSRYRVGFRGPDGAVIAHVDRRAEPTSVRNDSMTGSVPWGR